MKMNIDLGQEPMQMPVSAPEGPRDEKYYPSFHYCGDKELELPREGTMTIRYCVESRSEREDEDGDEEYSCTIKVKEIVAVDGEVKPPAKSGNETEDALDQIKATLEKLVESDKEVHKKLES